MSDNSTIHREAFDLLCHERIGYGMSREVYSSKLLPNSVIKIESSSSNFQNVMEWETWLRVRDTKISRWFARCEWISPCGSILIMERTRSAPLEKYPKKMPVFLCDFKYSNYGLSDGFLVCHDYGTHLLFENGMTKQMKKADWYNGD